MTVALASLASVVVFASGWSAPPKLLPKNLKVSDAQIERRLQARLTWYTQSLVTAYEQRGRRNVRWNEYVTSGLTLVARSWGLDPTRAGDTEDQGWYRLRRAIALGCDDPLVEYVSVRLSAADLDPSEAARRMTAAAMRLENTSYSVLHRGEALLRSAEALVASNRNASLEEWGRAWKAQSALVTKAFNLLPGVASDSSIPPQLLLRYVNDLTTRYAENIHQDRQTMFDMSFAVVAKARGVQDPVFPLMRAQFYAEYAWDARGAGSADEVKDESWPVFFERLQKAETEVSRAIAMRSQDPAIPGIMTLVAKGLHQDRRELESWFALATRLEPGDYLPYLSKLDWLGPRWYGSEDAVLAFARDLRRASNWGIRAPMVLLDAHQFVSEGPPKQPGYFQRGDVCDEIQTLYEDFLQRYPDAGYDRSRYALRLVDCGRWQDADRQFQLLTPDRVRIGVFGGQSKFDAKRKLAAARAKPQ